MTIPLWILLLFALWSLMVLSATIGVYRWGRILSGQAGIGGFRYDKVQGHPAWYRRGMRAHGNCIENLPVYGAIVVILSALGLDSPWLDRPAVVLMAARVEQSLVHVSFVETNITVSSRCASYFIQVLAMLGVIGIIIVSV
jgi:uncharacterized MAPEG superfamily protein